MVWVATRSSGVLLDFILSFLYSDFRFYSVLAENIPVIIIVEYFTTLMLDYFKDTLENVVLPKS